MSQQSDDSLENTGLSNEDKPVFLVIGQLGRPHGVRGEISFRIHTDFPERIIPGKSVFLGEKYRPFTIRSVRGGGGRLILSIEGVDGRDEAALLRNLLVYVRSDEIPDLEDDYYYHELLGLKVITDDGRTLGNLVEIIETGANDVFVVTSATGEEILLPAIDDVVLEIDIPQKTILVHMISGL